MKLISLRVYRLGEFPFHHTKKKIFPEGIQFVLNFTCIISKPHYKNTELKRDPGWLVLGNMLKKKEQKASGRMLSQHKPHMISTDRVLTQKT